ncbi:type II nitroreductase [Exophiala oligosperma]
MTSTTPVRIGPDSSSTFLDAIKYRRTIYGVTDNVSVSDGRIIEIVNEVIQIIPSSWNMQSTRIVVTLGAAHKKFWDAVINAARPFVLETKGESDWKRNEDRFNSFKAAYGTISLFEDHTSIENLHGRFSQFPITVFETFAEHSNAMHQIALWTALELEGLGASLQHSHFVPGVEDGIRSTFDIPPTWSVKAEIVFGALAGDRPTKPEKKPVSTTVKVFH